MKITMLEIEYNEYEDIIEVEYSVPIEVVKDYLGTKEASEVKEFVRGECTSEDTRNVIDMCMRKGIDYDIVRDELIGGVRF